MNEVTEKKLGDEDMKSLAKRIRATSYECDGTCRLSCEELNFNPSGEIFLKVVGNGVESVLWIEDNKIFANDELPAIEGVEMTPYSSPDSTKRYLVKC